MHYLAFSLGHKLHSSILLIYFVCMKQIKLLHASGSQLRDISLPYADAVTTTSVLHREKQPKGKSLIPQMSINYLCFKENPWIILPKQVAIFIESSTRTLFLIVHHFRLPIKRILDRRQASDFYFLQGGFLPLTIFCL